MSYLLVTNDDGIDSPALVPFLEALGEHVPVRAVVPDRERSWIGKAISRFDEIHVRTVGKGGFDIHVADGYPADCAQLGIHSLFGEKPEMVVSGINVGLNNGLGFFLSSGTAGADAEGWIAGLPAVAFSTGVTRDHRSWAPFAWSEASGELWNRAAAVSVEVLESIRAAGFPAGADLLNVNFTADTVPGTRRVVTDLAKVGYDNIFRESSPGRFVHDFSTGLRLIGNLEGTDVEALEQGLISVTPVRLAHGGEVDEAFRAAIEGT
jgi:5'-nucleotidase